MARTDAPSESFGFDGREIPIHPGDTIGSALYRAGVDTVSRSFKYHRRRGFLCMSGDCPNCLVQVDGETGVRCCTRAGERRHEGRAAERHVLARARSARA